jgi:hypothetical protein
MLTALLKILETCHGEIDTDQICAELSISPDTLQNLLDLLVRKGYITLPQPTGPTCTQKEICYVIGRACPGPDACSLVFLADQKVSFIFQESKSHR